MSREVEALDIANEAGHILLENGAEISRVEEVMDRISSHYGVDAKHFFVLSNGIFTTGQGYANVEHIPIHGCQLDRVVEVNQLSRDIEKHNLTLEQASRRLEKIRQMPNHPALEQILASALGSGAFCAIFGGSLLDCAISTLCGIILWIYVLWVSAPYLSKVIGNITGGMLVSLMCIISHHLIPSAHLGNMVIGAIIPLIPGISFTNGIRDLAAEDYLAGMTRLADALMVFFCMAIGVCTIFIIDSYIFGSMIQLHGMLTDPLTANWLIQIEVAYLGTVSFAVLFGVPRRFYHGAGICGTLGWIVYLVFTRLLGTSGIEAMFFATMIVVLSSYQCASTLHCPVIIFIVCGIFPLVPGAGVFWTSYYIVSDQLQAALNSGFMACKGTVAIVFGIIIMTEFSRRFKLFNVWNSFVKLLIKPLKPRY